MVEVVQRSNQYLKGKSEAFRGFRDCLAKEIVKGMPRCEGRVRMVMEGKNMGVESVGEGKDTGEEMKINGTAEATRA
jgi:hypothetical protein